MTMDEKWCCTVVIWTRTNMTQSTESPARTAVDIASLPSPGSRPSNHVFPAPELVSSLEKRALFVLTALLFPVLSIFTLIAYRSESAFYAEILAHARDSATCSENVMAFQVALAPFRSLSMVRTAALFLSFVLVLLGSLFVLTGIEAAYRMSLDLGVKKAALETASPGLVLVTAGALLIGASLYRSGSPEFRPAPCANSNSGGIKDDDQPPAFRKLNPQRDQQ